jgi:uncharacterized small protein (DUF1192 family)
MHRLVAVALGGLIAFSGVVAAQGNPVSLEALQAEIARLKERLAQLEAQLAEVQKQQKATENLTQRLQPLTVHGYIQMRYVRDTTQPTDANDLARGSARDTFRLRRVRLDVRGEPLRGVLYRLQLDAAETNTQIKDAYLELKAGDGTFTFGHFKVPLLEEVLESSSARLTPERARVSTELFPGERDRGIAYAWRKKKKGCLKLRRAFSAGPAARKRKTASLPERVGWFGWFNPSATKPAFGWDAWTGWGGATLGRIKILCFWTLTESATPSGFFGHPRPHGQCEGNG